MKITDGSRKERLPGKEQLLHCLCDDPIYEGPSKDSRELRGQSAPGAISNSFAVRSRHYGATSIALMLVEKWLEWGERPSQQVLKTVTEALSRIGDDQIEGKGNRDFSNISGSSLATTIMRLWEQDADDLPGLQQLRNDTRRLLWTLAPIPCKDSHLIVRASEIPGAELGLFAAQDLPANSICCYYYGDLHSIKSSQSSMLQDSSYLLRIGSATKRPWWYNALSPAKQKSKKEDGSDSSQPGEDGNRVTADSQDVYASLRDQWNIRMTQVTYTSEFFVDPTNHDIKARYINDCLNSSLYNVKFILDPEKERAAVVTLRPVRANEELYVSYGQAYWESQEATTGIVPRRLSQTMKDGECDGTSY